MIIAIDELPNCATDLDLLLRGIPALQCELKPLNILLLPILYGTAPAFVDSLNDMSGYSKCGYKPLLLDPAPFIESESRLLITSTLANTLH